MNAPAMFQSMMDEILRDVQSFSRAYMDDVVIFSCSLSDHLTHIREVLARIRAAGLTVNPNKCKWAGSSMSFLGHVVGGGIVAIPEDRASAIDSRRSSVLSPTTENSSQIWFHSLVCCQSSPRGTRLPMLFGLGIWRMPSVVFVSFV